MEDGAILNRETERWLSAARWCSGLGGHPPPPLVPPRVRRRVGTIRSARSGPWRAPTHSGKSSQALFMRRSLLLLAFPGCWIFGLLLFPGPCRSFLLLPPPLKMPCRPAVTARGSCCVPGSCELCAPCFPFVADSRVWSPAVGTE